MRASRRGAAKGKGAGDVLRRPYPDPILVADVDLGSSWRWLVWLTNLGVHRLWRQGLRGSR